jgi:Ca2+-binding EF-hand superfamily protein
MIGRLARIAASLALVAWPGAGTAQSLATSVDLAGLDDARSNFFSQADKDADLALSASELSDALAFTMSHAFDGNDYDGDGYVSYSEYLESGSEIFNELDRNTDGLLSPDEF